MSPSRSMVFGITWSWPVTILMLFIALLPVYGPLMSTVEGDWWPVTSKVKFVNIEKTLDGMIVRMSYTKNRNCEIVGVSLDAHNIPIEFVPIEGSVDLLQTRGTGPQISRKWFIGHEDLEDLRLRFIHRCHILWVTVTIAFP